MTYDSCANDYVNGRELHAHYNNASFMKCVYTSEDGKSIKTQEIQCGKLFEVPNYKKTILNRGIASEKSGTELFETIPKSKHGEWMNPFFELSN